MTKKPKPISTALIALIFFGCGEPTKDDVREKAFLKAYDETISDNNFCDAYKISRSRFSYISDRKTSDYLMAKRISEWDKRVSSSGDSCKKKLWPKIESSLKRDIEILTEIQSITNVTATFIGDYIGLDALNRECNIKTRIVNNSKFTISKIDGFWPKESEHGIKYQESFEFSPTQPGDKITLIGCHFNITNYIKSHNNSDLELKIESVTITKGEKSQRIKFYDLNSQLNELKNNLEKGYTGIQVPQD